ncbi:GNAT family N-acetyltransferase [Helicobacter anseris]|uniref:GNAT family N-acetyltransferase n=1 Tax=Helicobacter anseris TaxID=375926 RepID=A0A3D8JAN3_9HELI|nr:GNAT family N-acetyltransferase [Helicobacter anseris]RDU74583.1 GNAT family N-acetyltransferase [Helicobacter anseris]
MYLDQMTNHQTIIDIKPSFSELAIYHYLSEAKKFYPNFDLWYFTNVLPSLLRKEKQILTIKDEKNLKGVAIVKNTPEEKKICTLRVIEKYQNRGIGIKLFEKSFEALQTRTPLLSVSEEKYPDFKKIFDYYGFKLTSIKKDYYRIGIQEYFFNE